MAEAETNYTEEKSAMANVAVEKSAEATANVLTSVVQQCMTRQKLSKVWKHFTLKPSNK